MTAGAAQIISDARAALGRRDAASAMRLLSELPDAQMPWLMMAQACSLAGDAKAEEAALQRQLEIDPRHLPALILSGELKARLGDDRAANSFFQAALNQAATIPDVPASLHPMLNRARDFIVHVQAKFEQHLVDGLAQAGLHRDGRVGTAIDMLLGKKQLYVQQPSSFYFPGLPQRQFYERSEFPWIAEVENAVPAMQAELRAVLADGQDFAPYVEASSDLCDDPFALRPDLHSAGHHAAHRTGVGRPLRTHRHGGYLPVQPLSRPHQPKAHAPTAPQL